jgi:class 3 adenylate cyclase/tetratricopeptide (TPR) repeat protein
VAKCPSCRSRQPRAAVFCDRCGTLLGAPCPGCGAANRPGARFCHACGLGLEAPSAPASAPASAARQALASRVALEGERKHVTVLFADVKGSMELLAERDPEEARAILDPVLERLLEAVHHYEGTVNQVLGDGIMALFGAPVACEDHAVRACLAALRMQEAIARDARERPPAAHGIAIRVGLNSGDVVVRALRGDVRLDYTAVGHTTHLAARMEQLAAPGTVLATAATARLVEGYVRLIPRGEASVKGLETPVPVFEVAGRGPLRSRMDAAAARGLSPFVGRQEELDRLLAAWERARAGQGQVVAVVGETGVGKSRLVRELLGRAGAEGAAVLTADPPTWETLVPYAWPIDLLRRHFTVDGTLDPAATRSRVEQAAHERRLEACVPAFLALLDALPPDDPFHGLEPRRRRNLLHRAVAQLIVEQGRAGGAVAVFENAHAMDAGSRAALDEVAERAAKERLLVIVTARPGAADRWIERHASERLVLAPLAAADAERLLDALLGQAPELGPLKGRLMSLTEGNPFFLEEGVRALAQHGALIGARRTHRPGGAGVVADLPATVQAAIAARIDRLPAAEKQVLQSAAVIGRDFPHRLVRAIADLPGEATGRALAALVTAELIEPAGPATDPQYRFTHGLVHEVAYESVLHERRRLLHARIVETVERGSTGVIPVERLAHHAWQGGLWAAAARYFHRAGAKAAAHAANADALAFFERALEALGRLPESRETLEQAVDVRLELRPVLLQLGRLEAVLARSLEAERLAHALGDERRLAAVYSYLVNYHYLKGEPEIALGYGERCLALAERAADPTLRAQAARYMAQIHHTLAEYARARQLFTANLKTLGATTGEPDTALTIAHVSSAAWLAFTLAELGEFAAAHQAAAEAERAGGARRHPYGQAIAWSLGGLVWLRQGVTERALEPLERSLQACRERELSVWEPIAASLLGLALARRGRKDEALPLLEAGVTLSERLGVAAYLALWTLHLAEGQWLAGDRELAAGTVQRALDLAIRHRERGHEAWAQWLRGEIAAADASAGAAEPAYRRTLDLATALAMRPLKAHAHFGLGRCLERAGLRAQSEDHLVQALALFCEMDMRACVRAACEPLAPLGRTLVVARDRPAIHRCLDEVAAGMAGVRVIVDRRRGERRRRRLPPERERRSGERRQAEVARLLARHGLAIVA